MLLLARLLCRPPSPWRRCAWRTRCSPPARPTRCALQVTRLTETRARVVDAADAERRRIERDLHDGAQQRLVALAMNLGRARAKFDDDPEGARELVDQAHEEAKDAITELRNLVRGIHPAVLTDRGLDAALSAVAARSPVPVRLDVDVPERPSPTVEAVAYFVVSEALTNVARHAQARHVRRARRARRRPAARVDRRRRARRRDREARAAAWPGCATGCRRSTAPST